VPTFSLGALTTIAMPSSVCSHAGAVPTDSAVVRGYTVAAYWSNAHNRCITRRNGTG
jgi:hypothetical protein